MVRTLANRELQNQDRHWSLHAQRYDEVFLDPYAPGVENPLWAAIDSISDAEHKTVIDLGCGTGPLLPRLIERFKRVIALDFAPGMIERAKERIGPEAGDRVVFLQRPMHELDDLVEQIDVAVAVNSLVMPDVRVIDRTLRGSRESSTRWPVPGHRPIHRRDCLSHHASRGQRARPRHDTQGG